MSDWRKSAACAGYDPELWFPGNSQLMRREAIHIFDFLPVLKHRDSGIGVVPVVRVSLTVASSRRGEMESYTVSARV